MNNQKWLRIRCVNLRNNLHSLSCSSLLSSDVNCESAPIEVRPPAIHSGMENGCWSFCRKNRERFFTIDSTVCSSHSRGGCKLFHYQQSLAEKALHKQRNLRRGVHVEHRFARILPTHCP